MSAKVRSPVPVEIAAELSLLYSDLSSRYDVVEESLSIGLRAFSLLRVRDTNTLLLEVRPDAFAGDERLPYWAELWPSSIELARYCLEESDLRGKRVLELGCGLGLAGIAAAAVGARVCISDYEPDALLFARANAIRNLPQDIVETNMQFRLLDWRTDLTPEPFDAIIGADVVYERRNLLPILDFIKRTLKADGWAVVTDPDRSTGMPFFALAERQGFDVNLNARLVQHAQKTTMILRGVLTHAG